MWLYVVVVIDVAVVVVIDVAVVVVIDVAVVVVIDVAVVVVIDVAVVGPHHCPMLQVLECSTLPTVANSNHHQANIQLEINATFCMAHSFAFLNVWLEIVGGINLIRHLYIYYSASIRQDFPQVDKRKPVLHSAVQIPPPAVQARPGGISILLKLTCEQGLTRRHETGCRYSLVSSPVLLLLIADTRLVSLVEIASEMPPASHWSRRGGSTDVTLTAPHGTS